MMSDHQAIGPAQCWREVVSGTAGLHICIPRDDTLDQGSVAGEANMHIDPNQIAKRKDSDGTCNYSIAGSIDHGRDVGAGVIRRWTEQKLREVGKQLDEAGKFWKNDHRPISPHAGPTRQASSRPPQNYSVPRPRTNCRDSDYPRHGTGRIGKASRSTQQTT